MLVGHSELCALCVIILLLQLACGNCSQNLIDRLLLLVDNIISTINFLSDIDVQNYNQFDQLRNEALAVMVSGHCCTL